MGDGLKRAFAATAATRAKTPQARTKHALIAAGFKVKSIRQGPVAGSAGTLSVWNIRLFGYGRGDDMTRIHNIAVGCGLSAPDIQFVG